MINKEEYLEMHKRLLSLAKSHDAEYVDKWIEMDEDDDAPYFTFFKCNVPLLADVRMLSEEYNLRDCVESDSSWDYVAFDFAMHRFANQLECEMFRRMIEEFAKERSK